MTGTCSPPGKILLVAVLAVLLVMMPAEAQGSGTLTRGQTFTVTVIGLPRTAYDVWPKGTHDMTGEPGDQPPLIVAGQVDVAQDPPGGPYTIGSHPIAGGGTIRDDVPPDSSVVSATSYYAEVRTDASGHGVVLFRTSSATATRQFHITAGNPANPDEGVGLVLGVPEPAPTPVVQLPLPTTMKTPFIPPPTTAVPVTPVPTPTPAMTTPAPGTPPPATTAQPTSLPTILAPVAAAAGLLWVARMREP